MLARMWMSGLTAEDRRQPDRLTGIKVSELKREVRDLKEFVGKMALMNQALWEILRDRLQLSDEDLAAIAEEIDMRDGVQDGKITETALRCPECHRVSNSRHWRCLYCGLDFEKPLMG